MSEYKTHTDLFKKWICENFTTVSAKFEIQDLTKQGQGRGLIATDNIKKDEIIFELSRDIILNVDNAAITQLLPENKSILYSLNQWQSLIICVAYEWYLGDKSKFIDYFNVLPLKTEDFSSLMFWSDDELQYLKPSGVLDRIGKDSAEEMYAILVSDIIPNSLNCAELAEFLTLERFHIVASLILSYSFDVDHSNEVERDDIDKDEKIEELEEKHASQDAGEHVDKHDKDDKFQAEEEEEEEDDDDDDDESVEDDDSSESVSQDTYLKSMVPLADTLNSNTSLVNAKLKYENTTLVMVAEREISKGEQIFNIYGDLPNSEILRKYGYVELPSSKFEFAEIHLSSITIYFEELFEKRFTFLKKAQIDKLVETIFETIQESEYILETMEPDMESGIVTEKYEIYADGEILPELLLLLLITTAIFKSAESDEKWFKKMTRGLERKPSADFISFIDRTILKSHQLLEDKGILTKGTVENLEEILKIRISQYPMHIIDGSYTLPSKYDFFTKKEMSNIVLYNEVKCFKDVIDGKFPPRDQDGTARFFIISDDKFLKNLLKRKTEENDAKTTKKQRKK